MWRGEFPELRYVIKYVCIQGFLFSEIPHNDGIPIHSWFIYYRTPKIATYFWLFIKGMILSLTLNFMDAPQISWIKGLQ